MSDKGHLPTFVLVFAGVLAATIAMNVSVDAGGLGDRDAHVRLVSGQGDGDIIVSEELGYQREWVRQRLVRGPCPEVLVLGSSTSGEMTGEMFGGRSFVNGWLGGPSIEDFEAITNVLGRVSCAPSMIVIGADPWWVGNPHYDDQRWQAVLDEVLAYKRGESSMGYGIFFGKIEWNRAKERLNFTTTKESAKILIDRGPRSTPLAEVIHASASEACADRERLHFHHARSADGHYTLCPSLRPSSSERATLASRWLADNMHRMAEWNELDTSRLERFRRVVDAWSARGSRVVIMGNPYHPDTYQRLRGDPSVGIQLARLDAALTEIARTSRNATFVDLRDPAVAGCVESQFEDADHGDPTCVKKVVERVLTVTEGSRSGR